MKKNTNLTAEIAGWYGAIAFLTAYILVSFEILSASGAVFQLLNLTGAIGIIVISIHKNVKQSVVMNIFWGSVAIAALVKLLVE